MDHSTRNITLYFFSLDIFWKYFKYFTKSQLNSLILTKKYSLHKSLVPTEAFQAHRQVLNPTDWKKFSPGELDNTS